MDQSSRSDRGAPSACAAVTIAYADQRTHVDSCSATVRDTDPAGVDRSLLEGSEIGSDESNKDTIPDSARTRRARATLREASRSASAAADELAASIQSAKSPSARSNRSATKRGGS